MSRIFNKSETEHYQDRQFDRSSYLSASARDDKEEKLEWFRENVEGFDFKANICPKCNNDPKWKQTIFRDHFDCECGFQAWNREVIRREVALTEEQREPEFRKKQEYPNLEIIVDLVCENCKQTYQAKYKAKVHGRKYCNECKPKMSVKHRWKYDGKIRKEGL
jgi:hypothetical protein